MNGCSHGGWRHPRLPFLLLPVLLAAVCFSYALATPAAPPAAPCRASAAQSRFAVQLLRFTTPFLAAGSDFAFAQGGNVKDDPQGFDLGDACAAGSILRYITGAGGYLPYTFTLKPLLGSQSNGTGAAPASLPSLSPAGILNGNMPADVSAFLRFNVQLSDVIGTQRLGTFRVNVVPRSPTLFRFAHDKLATAQLANSYFTNIETVGHAGSFSAVTGSVTVAGTGGGTFNQLEDVGLALAPDGVLFGRPTKTGDITFKAHAAASDNPGLVAKSRAGLNDDQQFTITVEQSVPLTSELLATQCAIRGNRVVGGTDTFSYAGCLDTRGATAARLAGSPFQLRIGRSQVFSGTLDDKGRIKPAPKPKGAKSAGLSLAVKLSPASNRLTIKLSGASLAAALGIAETEAIDKTFRTVVIGLDIGLFRTTEVLKMETRAPGAASFRLDYALGRRGFSRAGGCQIVSVTGKDSMPVADPTGDRWLVRVLSLPGQDAETAATASAAVLAATSPTVDIGDFSQKPSLTKQSVRLVFKATGKDTGLYRMWLDPMHFVHKLETNVIGVTESGIPAAITTKEPTVFPFGLSFTGFNGQTGRIIAPNRSAWKQR